MDKEKRHLEMMDKLRRQMESQSKNSAIMANILDPRNPPEVRVATAHPVPMDEPERFVRDQDCPAIDACNYAGNVRGCCQKGDPYNNSPQICIQGLLLLIAKIHGVLPDKDSEERD